MIASKLNHKSSFDSPFSKLCLSWTPSRAGQVSGWKQGPESRTLSFSIHLRVISVAIWDTISTVTKQVTLLDIGPFFLGEEELVSFSCSVCYAGGNVNLYALALEWLVCKREKEGGNFQAFYYLKLLITSDFSKMAIAWHSCISSIPKHKQNFDKFDYLIIDNITTCDFLDLSVHFKYILFAINLC